MSYTESNITIQRIQPYDGGVMLTIGNGNSTYVLQIYRNGDLVAHQSAHTDTWTVSLSGVASTDLVLVLAVDTANAETNYWDDAYPSEVTNRLQVKFPQTIAPHLPSDVYRVYRGDAGDESATILVHEAPIYPGGRRACGFGSYFGDAFGWDGHDCRGFGYNFGYGEFGFDCAMLEWESDPLPLGTYPVKVTVVDNAGNESTATTGSITLVAYPRPAADLAVTSYTKGTDALAFSFTESADL